MSGRPVRRFVDGLLRGQRTERARPDDIEAAGDEDGHRVAGRPHRQRRRRARSSSPTCIAGWPAMDDESATAVRRPSGTRRQVVIGTGLAAASAATGIVVGRNLLAPTRTPGEQASYTQGVLEPNTGTWRAVGVSVDVPRGGALAFDLGSVNGFVHRTDGQLEAVSGVCTHQGCKLWLDAPDSRLRCPCHSTSFSLEGETLTHQLPTAPAPLPKFEVRENNGVIEVFAPTAPA